MAIGRRQRHARHRHQRQPRLRLPCRKPGRPRTDLPRRRCARRADRGAGGLLRSSRLRSAPNRGGARRTDRRCDLSDRRTAGAVHAACTALRYVKPHGALYNTVVTDVEQARAVAEAVHTVDPSLPVLGLAGSAFFDEANRLGLRTVAEAFADRAYQPDGRLVPRMRPGAVLSDPAHIADRALGMVRTGEVTAVDGTVIRIQVESVCVHGDSPRSVEIAAAVRDQLLAGGVELLAFA